MKRNRHLRIYENEKGQEMCLFVLMSSTGLRVITHVEEDRARPIRG
jgi:hypothetical protein